MKKFISILFLTLLSISLSYGKNYISASDRNELNPNIKVIGVIQNAHDNPNNSPGLNIVAKVTGNYSISQVQLWWDNLDDLIPPGPFPGYFTRLGTSDYFTITINTALIGNFNSGDRIMWRIEAIDNQNNHYYYPTFSQPYTNDTTKVFSYYDLNSNLKVISGNQRYVLPEINSLNSINMKNNKFVNLQIYQSPYQFLLTGNELVSSENILSGKSLPWDFLNPPSINVLIPSGLPSDFVQNIVFSKNGSNNPEWFTAADFLVALSGTSQSLSKDLKVQLIKLVYHYIKNKLAYLLIDANFQNLAFQDKLIKIIADLGIIFLKDNCVKSINDFVTFLIANGVNSGYAYAAASGIIYSIVPFLGSVSKIMSFCNAFMIISDYGSPPYTPDTIKIKKSNGTFTTVTGVTLPGVNNPVYQGITTNFALYVTNDTTQKLYNVWVGFDIYGWDYNLNKYIKIENTKTDFIDPETGQIGLIDFGSNQGADINPGETKLYISNNYTFNYSVTGYQYKSLNKPYKYIFTAWTNGQPGQTSPIQSVNTSKDLIETSFLIRDNIPPNPPVLSNLTDYEQDSTAVISWSISGIDTLDVQKVFVFSNNINIDTVDNGISKAYMLKKKNSVQNVFLKAVDIGGLLSQNSNNLQIERISLYPTVFLLSPGYDSLITTSTPLLDWTDAPSPINYQVQISTDSVFNVIIYTNNVTTSQQVVPPGILTSNQKYYWRVRVNYSGSNTSRWSLAYRFRTPNFIANIPQLLSPSNGSTGITLTPTLKWSNSLGLFSLLFKNENIFNNEPRKYNPDNFTGYWLQISSNANFTNPEVNNVGIVDTFYNVPNGNLVGNTLYRWRVKASNINGDTSAWSQVWTFTTVSGGSLPPQPRLISPTNNASNVSLTPLLDWNDTSNVTNYQIQISVNQNFLTNILDVTIPAIPSQYDVSSGVLSGNTNYYWHVRGINSSGNGIWSNPFQFTTAITQGGCTAPNLISPSNNSTGQSLTPLLTWSTVSGASSYLVVLDSIFAYNGSNSRIYQYVYTGSSYQVQSSANLTVNKTYYWRVETICGSYNSSFAGPYAFTTGSYQIPDRPVLSSPNNGAIGQALNVPLVWWPVINANSYTIEVGNDTTYNPPLFTVSGISGTEFDPTNQLTYNYTYYWHVKAVNSLGQSNWSWSRHFTTMQATTPDPPQLISPANNATNQPLTPTLVWSQVSGATDYHMQLTLITDTNYTNCIINWNSGGVTQYQYLTGLNNNQTYKWRVYSTNGSQNSNYSNVYLFTTIASSTPPSQPVLNLPTDTTTGITLTPTLSWNNIPSASTYGIQVALDTGFQNKIIDQTGWTQLQYTVSSNQALSYFTKYYWRVNASNQAGTSFWSNRRSFTTMTMPIIGQLSDTILTGMGQVYDIKQNYQYLYVLADAGFYRINMDDPANLYVKNSVPLPSGIGFYAAQAAGRNLNTSFQINNGYAFIGNGTSGLTVVDVSNPNYMTIVKTLSNVGTLTNIEIKDSVLYGLDFSSYQNRYVNVISIKNPLNPYLITTFDGSHGNLHIVFNMLRINNYLYFAARWGNIYWWNITNPNNPSYGSTTHNPVNSDFVKMSFDASTNYLYLEDYSPPTTYVYTVNTSTGQLTPVYHETYSNGNRNLPLNIAERSNILYITDWENGAAPTLWNYTNPTSPAYIGFINGTTYGFDNPYGLYLTPNYCFMGCNGQILTLPLGGLTPSGRLDLRGNLADVKIKGNYLYAAAGNGLVIYDISNKAYPQQVALENNCQPNRLYCDSTNYLYCLGTTVVYIYNISNPSTPTLQSTFRIPYKVTGSNDYNNIGDIVVKNNIGYVFFMYRNGYSSASWEEKGMATFDLSNKSNPVLLNKFYFDDHSREVSALLFNTDLYTIERNYHLDDIGGYGGINRIVKYSISNPTNPTMIQDQNIGDGPLDFAKVDTSFYVITGTGGGGSPGNPTLRYISLGNFNIYKTIALDNDPVALQVPNQYIYITKGNNFEIHSKDTSFSLIASNSYNAPYVPCRFVIDSPYVHAATSLSLTTFPLALPVPLPAKTYLTSPENGSSGQTLTPTLNWGTIMGATNYYLQVSTHSNFDILIVNQTNLLSSYYSVSSGYLTYNTLYYWRVAASNGGGSGPWSDVWNFRTNLRPPSPPIPLNPPNNSLILTLTPTLSWNDSLIFDKIKTNTNFLSKDMITDTTTTYRVQVATNNMFDKGSFILDTSGLLSKQLYISSGKLNYNSQYYWRVKSFIGQIDGDWSNLNSFITSVSTPQLLMPRNDTTGILTNQTIIWKSVNSATKYHLQISIDSLFSTIFLQDSTLTDTTKSVSTFQPFTKYFWRVRGGNNNGFGNYSIYWKFKTLGVPTQVQLVYPPKDTTNISINITFKWRKSYDQTIKMKDEKILSNIGRNKENKQKSDKINLKEKQLIKDFSPLTVSNFWFEIVNDTSSMTGLIRDTLVVDTIKSISGLQNLTSYFWRVKSKNEIGWGYFSNWWKFTTIVPIPVAPTLLTPLNNATDISLTPLMDWNDVNYASSYRFQISTDSLFGTTNMDTTGVAVSQLTIPSGKLNHNIKYYWRVNASNIAGTGPWSTIWNFRTLQNLSINLKVYLEGFWDGSSQVTDTVRVYLAMSTSPYTLKDSAKVVLSSTGTAVPLFTKTINGSYYIAVKHRNHLETWSKYPQTFTGGTPVNYDFTTAANKAYGDNMKQVGSVWVFYGGDPNQDGSIDAMDISIFMIQFGLTGSYLSCDFNGDGSVDAMDVQIIAANFGLTSSYPTLDNNGNNGYRNIKNQNQSKGKIDKVKRRITK